MAMLAVLATYPTASVDPAALRQLIQEEVQRAVTPLQETVARLEAENARLVAAATQQQMRVGVSPMGGTGRQLSHDSSSTSCCRWTASDSCGSHTRQCTGLHEYLEAKTTTHEFANVEHADCLGSDSGSTWGWTFDGHKGNITLSSGGSAVTSFKTPLRVTHAQSCSTDPPALTVQLDTTFDYNVQINGGLTAAAGISSTPFGGFDSSSLTLLSRFVMVPPPFYVLTAQNLNYNSAYGAPYSFSAGVTVNAAGDEFTFDGSTSYVQIDRTVTWDFTILFDVKTTDAHDGVGGSCSGWGSGVGLVDAEMANDMDDFGVTMCDGKITFGIGRASTTSGGAASWNLQSSATYNDGNWHSVKAIREWNGEAQLYVDGARVGREGSASTANLGCDSAAVASGVCSVVTSPSYTYISIGRIQTDTRYFTGTMRNVALYTEVAPVPLKEDEN